MATRNRFGDTNETAIFQWLLECPSLANILNWPITADSLASSGIHLHMISKDADADAEKVAQAWRKFAAAMGPTVTSNVFHDEHWRDLVPEVEIPSEDTRAVVWEGKEANVAAQVVFDEHGNAINLDFVVEPK
ncbi:MAG: hypothetical protein ACR2NF_07415 [Pirellulales bacterium]